jgi:hypothetical protein
VITFSLSREILLSKESLEGRRIDILRKEGNTMAIVMLFLKFILGAALVTGVMWGGIKLLDPLNDKNSLFMAIFCGVGVSIMGICGSLFAILPFIAFLYLFINFYNLGMIKSFAITFVMASLYFGMMFGLTILQAVLCRPLH